MSVSRLKALWPSMIRALLNRLVTVEARLGQRFADWSLSCSRYFSKCLLLYGSCNLCNRKSSVFFFFLFKKFLLHSDLIGHFIGYLC